jgi:hypothetical protein
LTESAPAQLAIYVVALFDERNGYRFRVVTVNRAKISYTDTMKIAAVEPFHVIRQRVISQSQEAVG